MLIHAEPGPGFPGLRFDLPAPIARARPRLSVEATAHSLILGVDGRDHLFARVHPHHQGVRLCIAPQDAVRALPPISADDVRSVEDAARVGRAHAWARWFVNVVADRGLLPPGEHAITTAFDVSRPPGKPATGAPENVAALDDFAPCLRRPDASWMSWWSDDREVLRLRAPSVGTSSRVKAWRKRARDGTLPPLLLWFVSGLDTCVLLDGHDRLLAANEEGIPPRLLVLWRYARRRRPFVRMQRERLLDELADRRAHPSERRPALDTEHENRLLLEAFAPSEQLMPTTRATRLAGGSAAFERRAREALGALVDERFLAGREPVGEATGCGSEKCAAELGWRPGS